MTVSPFDSLKEWGIGSLNGRSAHFTGAVARQGASGLIDSMLSETVGCAFGISAPRSRLPGKPYTTARWEVVRFSCAKALMLVGVASRYLWMSRSRYVGSPK